ncbi:hypothetical protein TSUD_19080 [Trifolium subterraneum]|uniref:Endonuclease/exonuclease/phosphatase domain-containing protein n=1 Tax=Trifolium subterraneum TaxID=3900 RepID=A0A2Z6MNS4_TRISU|nr:hypothetical protein TSUD_19080 [Trifolium subterraneum]
MESWLLTVVYASPRENERSDTWIKLLDISRTIQESWLMMGDFNEIMSIDEKKGGAPVDIRRCSVFSDWINDCNLLEVHTIGTKFTWRGPKWNGHDRGFKKLDRVLCNVAWRLKLHEGLAKVIPRGQSDHHPLVVLFEGMPVNGGNRLFRFEAAWITHADFNRMLMYNWGGNYDLIHTLSNLTIQLKEWNRETFGNTFKRKKEILSRLGYSPLYFVCFLQNLVDGEKSDSFNPTRARTWRELPGTVSLQPHSARTWLENPELSDLLSLLARSARLWLEKPELSDLLLLLARCFLA